MFLYKKIKLLETISNSSFVNENTTTTTTTAKQSKLKNVLNKNIIDNLLNPSQKNTENSYENEYGLESLNALSNVNQLELISKQYEESYMKQSIVGNSCCNGFSCVGHLLINLHDWPKNIPGFTLQAFETPNGKKYKQCVLCLRRSVTETYLSYALHNKTCMLNILPYRNNVNDYPKNHFIAVETNSKHFGITDPFVYFSFTHYMYYFDNGNHTIAHRSDHLFHQSEECLAGYSTIESCDYNSNNISNVGLLVDISNIIPFVLTHSNIAEKKEKFNEQHELILFLRKAIKHSEKKNNNLNKSEKIKYQYIINSSSYVFKCENVYTGLDRMVNYFATVWQPDFMHVFKKTYKPEPDVVLKLIPLPKHLKYKTEPTFGCLDCFEADRSKNQINSPYVYDYINDKFMCKKSSTHKLIKIEFDGNLIQYKNFTYMPCSLCKKILRISSGTNIIERGLKNAKDYNKLLKRIHVIDIYTHQCIYCKYHKQNTIKCLLCNVEFIKNGKKPWQYVRVFGHSQKMVYLCPMEKNIKQTNGGDDKIWSYELLLEFLKS